MHHTGIGGDGPGVVVPQGPITFHGYKAERFHCNYGFSEVHTDMYPPVAFADKGEVPLPRSCRPPQFVPLVQVGGA